ncbi:MAG: AraC family transcriptional regulator [Clostridia bacterium]|nr:AraC family transcriptional regulator [Clostridia bacterium]
MFAEINREAIKNLPFALVTLETSTRQPPLTRVQGLGYHQILWVVEGSCTYHVGKDVFNLSAGEGIYMRPNVPHSYDGKGLYTAWCTFSADNGLPDYLGIGDYMYFKAPPLLNSETEQLMALCMGDSTVLERSTAGYIYVTDFFTKIFKPREAFSDKVDRILERRYAEQISLFEIADELETDKYTLCRRYKKEKGVTVIDELTRIRLQKAKQYLKYHSASVEEIGRMCGFESPSYFGKRFREAAGCTPFEYRKNKQVSNKPKKP